MTFGHPYLLLLLLLLPLAAWLKGRRGKPAAFAKAARQSDAAEDQCGEVERAEKLDDQAQDDEGE